MSITGLAFLLFFIFGLIAAYSVNLAWGFYLYEMVYFLNPGNRWWSTGIPNFKYSFTVVAVTILLYTLRTIGTPFHPIRAAR